MFCLGISLPTTAICIACVLISIMPLKTTHRSDLQPASRLSGEGGKEPSKSGQDTESVENTASADQATIDPSGKPAKVKAIRMSALWPKTGDHPVIPWFLASETAAGRSNMSFIYSIFNYVSERTCIKFDPLFPETDCFVKFSDPTVCVIASGDACFSDETGCQSGAAFDDEAQVLHAPIGECPFHEAVQSVAKLLGLLPEHRRRDRDDTLRVTVTASGTDQLLFAQGQTARCTDYEDDSPLDLFSATGLDTSATTLRHGDDHDIYAIEHGMVVRVRDIRHQWILDYKRQRNMGLSFYDERDLIQAYDCEEVWGCGSRAACINGGFHDRSCLCVCPPGFGGETCSARTLPAGEDGLRSNCSILLRNELTFTLGDIGLREDGHQFYACDLTLVPPGCMRPLVLVNTSTLSPLRIENNPDFMHSNWCDLYFTLMLTHSVMGWRTYCLDYFFNEEILMFMSHTSIEHVYGYIKMRIPRKEVFHMVAGIAFNITFVEVPECGKKGVRDSSAAIHTHGGYTVMTAVFSYLAGVMLGIVGWMVVRGLSMSHQDDYPSHDSSPTSGSSSYDSLPTSQRTPIPQPGTTPPAPDIRRAPPDTRQAPPDTRQYPPDTRPAPDTRQYPPNTRPAPPDTRQYPPNTRPAPPDTCPPPPNTRPAPPDTRPPPPNTRPAPPDTRPPPPNTRPAPPYPPVTRPPQTPAENRPMRPTPERPPPQQETHLPPIGGAAGQKLSPRQGGLRASFAHWGGAALDNMRASFAGASRPPPDQRGPAPQRGTRPQPQGGTRPPSQGGTRPQPQGGSQPPPPQGGRQPKRYKTSPTRPTARRAPP